MHRGHGSRHLEHLPFDEQQGQSRVHSQQTGPVQGVDGDDRQQIDEFGQGPNRRTGVFAGVNNLQKI